MKPHKIYRAAEVDIDKLKYYLIYFLDDNIIEYKLHNEEYQSSIMEVLCKNTKDVKDWLKFYPNDDIQFIKLWFRLEKHKAFYGFIIFNITTYETLYR